MKFEDADLSQRSQSPRRIETKIGDACGMIFPRSHSSLIRYFLCELCVLCESPSLLDPKISRQERQCREAKQIALPHLTSFACLPTLRESYSFGSGDQLTQPVRRSLRSGPPDVRLRIHRQASKWASRPPRRLLGRHRNRALRLRSCPRSSNRR